MNNYLLQSLRSEELVREYTRRLLDLGFTQVDDALIAPDGVPPEVADQVWSALVDEQRS